jgi:hypothetical protein
VPNFESNLFLLMYLIRTPAKNGVQNGVQNDFFAPINS